ncbi:MAG: glycosyltransferase family 2 protein [archaeon]
MNPYLSVILPCRDEEATVGLCIKKIQGVLAREKINGEIIISDSSHDDSAGIARKLGATVVRHTKGYGNALLEGFRHAKGTVILYGDADNTYDFNEIPKFLKAIKGCDLVVGTRLKGDIKKGAMLFLHRYLGNPLLSGITNLLFGSRLSDVHSGMRAIKAEALARLKLNTTGMEFATEMIIKAVKADLRVCEVPISYYPRVGESKLDSFRDGWKHLRFMLLYSPDYLFIIPGFLLLVLAFSLLLYSTLSDGLLHLPVPFIFSLSAIGGYQILLLGIFAKTYASVHLGEHDPWIDLLNKHISVEKGIIIGSLILLTGLLVSGFTLTITNLTVLIIGMQTIFSSFFLSILGIERK